MSERRTIAVVPHTHWDREWYEPFQTFRFKLVELLDTLLPLMEQDPSYRRFLLDGQMAVVDDYLEIRPENEDRIRSLAASGRLTMGPWYILMDEFLVSGETIVRNIQMGIKRGAAFGGVMEVGYLPDMFGHIAQMPQILSQAGLTDTVLWRGVPSAITKTGFRWIAPDGSSVRAEYLPVGYGNGAALPSNAPALVHRVTDHVQEIGTFLMGPLLLMNGSDHLLPQAHLGRVLEEANALQDDFHFEICSLPEYLQMVERDGLEEWTGELRSGFRSNMLMGVTSNRVDVKLAAGITERALERRAEPLAALFGSPTAWPEQLLELAWLEVIRNSAHDSICACSVDDVVAAVLHRFAEARAIAEGIEGKVIYELAMSFEEGGEYVLNATQSSRGGVVEFVLAGDDVDETSMQVLSEASSFPSQMDVDGETLRTILGLLNGPRITNDAWILSASVEEVDDQTIALSIAIGPNPNPLVELDELRRDLYTRVGANPALKAKISIDQPRIRRVATTIAPVNGFSWKPLQPVAPTHPVELDPTTLDGSETWSITNGLVDVVIDPVSGTFSINGVAGFGQLVDEGDLGDSYNYSPPAGDQLIDAPTSVVVSPLHRGPIRASVKITSTYEWPSHVDATRNRRTGVVEGVVTTIVEVKADDAAVHVSTSFANPARDHRLRIHLPLPVPAQHSVAECAFGVVERGLTAEGRPDELGLATAPSRRFVQAGGLTVVHEGLNEYELVDRNDDETEAGTLALTLLRSTGMLSRLGMKYRPFPAGPLTPVEGLQMVGSNITARYSIAFGDVDPWVFADSVLQPLDVLHAEGGGTRQSEGAALSVSGAIISSIRRSNGVIELRCFNPTGEPTSVDFGTAGGWEVDLRGEPLRQFAGTLDLGAYKFTTVRLANEG